MSATENMLVQEQVM